MHDRHTHSTVCGLNINPKSLIVFVLNTNTFTHTHTDEKVVKPKTEAFRTPRAQSSCNISIRRLGCGFRRLLIIRVRIPWPIAAASTTRLGKRGMAFILHFNKQTGGGWEMSHRSATPWLTDPESIVPAKLSINRINKSRSKST